MQAKAGTESVDISKRNKSREKYISKKKKPAKKKSVMFISGFAVKTVRNYNQVTSDNKT